MKKGGFLHGTLLKLCENNYVPIFYLTSAAYEIYLLEHLVITFLVSADVSKIQCDDELQSWGKLLSTSMKNGGAGFKVKRHRTIFFGPRTEATQRKNWVSVAP